VHQKERFPFAANESHTSPRNCDSGCSVLAFHYTRKMEHGPAQLCCAKVTCCIRCDEDSEVSSESFMRIFAAFHRFSSCSEKLSLAYRECQVALGRLAYSIGCAAHCIKPGGGQFHLLVTPAYPYHAARGVSRFAHMLVCSSTLACAVWGGARCEPLHRRECPCYCKPTAAPQMATPD